jgi:DNA-binding NarL/FixJ family response regulator
VSPSEPDLGTAHASTVRLGTASPGALDRRGRYSQDAGQPPWHPPVGLEATRRIAADDDMAGVRVIILTTFESDEYVYQAIRAGASGFLVKDSEPAELIQAVRVVARGEALLSPSVTRKLITDLASRPGSPRPTGHELDGLTDRERQVLTLVAAGLSNDEIAGRLYVSPLTSKTHVGRIMTKLDAHDRAQLVVLAYECGLVVPGQRAAMPGSPPG